MQSGQLRRREFITGLAGAAAWPIAGLAQQRVLPLIGILNSGTEQLRPDQFDGLHRGLKETGFVAGTNVTVISRGADDNYDRLPALAAEFVRLPVAVIATAGGPVAALAARAATSTIPIVFAAVSDPVKSGLVASLSRPGGNITGNAGFSIELDAKRLELLSELAPAARAIGALVNPNRPGVEAQEKEMLAAAKTAGRELTVLHTGDPRAIEIAFATLTERKIAALLIGADALFNNHRPQIVALAARHGIVAMYPWNEFVTEGGTRQLCAKFDRGLSPIRSLCRPHSERREASRSACHTADQGRVGDQPQDRQGAWPRCTAIAARPRG